VNTKDRQILDDLISHLRRSTTLSSQRLDATVSILEGWQDADRTMLPGHVDKVFNNFGSGGSDR